ncbi:MAG: WYL domain-containing protein [Devosia sp.]
MGEQSVRPWGQAKRFEFLEWRLFWVGRLNRADLEDQFGISTPQASIDLRNYQEAAPGNLSYSPTLKAYVRGKCFSPKFLRVSGERYLLQMRALHMGVIGQGDTWFGEIPPFDVVPRPTRTISDEDLRIVVAAVSNCTSLEVTYRSFSGCRDRAIAPHSFAYDGYRWHVRAWCFDNKEFRDFTLSRLIDPRPIDREPVSSDCDAEWTTVMQLRLSPHPGLSEDQRKTVEMDYGMEDGQVEINVRLALAFYFIQRNNLDKPLEDAARQQVVLSNLREINLATEMAKKESRRLVGLHLKN